jgi:FixJ family two-component response regulator
MPEFDGWKTLEHLTISGYNNLPVIIISADKNGGLNEKALKRGAVGFLQKPFNDEALVDLIKIAFENKGRA